MFTPKIKRLGFFLLLLLVLLVLFFFLFKKIFWSEKEEIPSVPREQIPVQETPQKEEAFPFSEHEEQLIAESNLQTLATSFVERFGSFSSQSDFTNIKDVYPLVTEVYQKELEDLVEKSVPPAEYYGVTTRVLSIKIQMQDEQTGVATLLVSTQKEEAVGSVQNVRVRYQDIILHYVKEGGVWKVNAAAWQ